jgi:hypothetical protein
MQKVGQAGRTYFNAATGCLFVLLATTITVHCQDSTYLVRSGIHPTKVIPFNERYQYPKFQRGVLHFYAGEKSEEFLLNYYHFAQQIQLIDPNGDTVALDNKMSIVEFIQIQSDFYFKDLRQGYLLVLTKEEPLNLMKRIGWKSVYFPNGESSFQKVYEYFFLAPPNKAHKAEKSSLTKLFPDNRNEINKYVSERKFDFTSESDLRDIVSFCNGLAITNNQK